jgi:hypothetical protein
VWLRDDPNPRRHHHGDLPIDPDTSYVSRMWTPHKRFRALADSPMRRARLVRRAAAAVPHDPRAARSRLAGNGLLLIAAGTVDARHQPDDDDPESDPFFDELTKAMLTPIGEEGDASAVVPLVARVPGECSRKARRRSTSDFDRPFDAEGDGAAPGADQPDRDRPRPAEGGRHRRRDLNHWTAWQVDDNTFRHHIEPDVIARSTS